MTEQQIYNNLRRYQKQQLLRSIGLHLVALVMVATVSFLIALSIVWSI